MARAIGQRSGIGSRFFRGSIGGAGIRRFAWVAVMTSGYYDTGLGGDDRYYGYDEGVTSAYGSMSRTDYPEGRIREFQSFGSVNRPGLRIQGAQGQNANFARMYLQEPAGGFTEFKPNVDVIYQNDGDDYYTWQNEPHLNTFEPAGADFVMAFHPAGS